MTKLIFVLFVLMFAAVGSAYAENWGMYQEDLENGDTFWIDRSSIHMVENRNALFDLKVEMKGNDGMSKVMWTQRADCINNKYKVEKETIVFTHTMSEDKKAELISRRKEDHKIWIDTQFGSIVHVICMYLFDSKN